MTTSLNPHRPQVLELYKSLLRLHRRFPPQTKRVHRLSVYIHHQIKSKFRAHRTLSTDSEIRKALQEGWKERDALRDLVEGNVEKNYPLQEGSTLKSHLPTRGTYRLLDNDTEAELEKLGPLEYLRGMVGGWVRRISGGSS
ncbi:hypothetical protein HDV05_007229 [Chytridiales sp. JEL 0842]|nr:hypothetical protein HDV05_007229 [Chytridiales sp. JEL 0842]